MIAILEKIPVEMQMLIFGLLMSVVSMIGALLVTMGKERLDRFMTLFIAMASGSLLGGAFFHLIPHSIEEGPGLHTTMTLICAGMLFMYAAEIFLHWHHCRCEHDHKGHQIKPYGRLILFADGFHNFIDGIGIGAGFLIDPKLGLSMWFIAVLHEIPQEVGDYMVLLNSGWSKKKALAFNFFSALAFPVGMFFVYALGNQFDLTYLIPIAAGNFIYIAASDLIPEIKTHPKFKAAFLHLIALTIGFGLLILPTIFGGHH